MRRPPLLLLPAVWILTAAVSGPTRSAPPSPSATPAPTPTPSTGQVSLDPTFGPPGTQITIAGSQFRPGEQVSLYWGDPPGKPLGGVKTGADGSFRLAVAAPDDGVGPHTICAPEANPGPRCATFRLEAKPSPTPSATASPTPTPLPTATGSPAAPSPLAAATAADRIDTMAVVTRPPFVFFPILLVAAALGAAAWIWWGRRPPVRPVRSAVVRHASIPTPTSLPQPRAPVSPPPTEEQRPTASPRAAPADESIDMPQPGD